MKNASERGLGEFNLENIEFLGLSLEDAKKLTPKFKVPGRLMTRLASFITRNIVYKVTKKRPILKKKLCVQCGQCFEVCPAKTINFSR
jgi:ferredoxin